MQIDPLTLMLPGAFTLALAGILLTIIHFQSRDGMALLWWSTANLVNAASVGLLIAGIVSHQDAVMATGSLLSSVAPALYWAGIRSFNKRSAPLIILSVGALAWIAAAGVAELSQLDHEFWAVVKNFLFWPLFCGAAVWELWSTRSEKLAYRWPMAGFLAIQGVVYLGGLYDTINGNFIAGAPPQLFSWFGVIHFESLLFAAGGSTALLLMAKERSANRHIAAANIDPLTGAANRRTFFEGAERLFQRCDKDGSPVCVIMLDLDRFKSVNDNFGHKAGDEVLSGFAEIMRSFLRPTDLFGRYGGEEFVLVLPNVSIEAAYAIADRARNAFSRNYANFNGTLVGLTISAGIAQAAPGQSLDAVISAADAALYAAKVNGRNRVMRADLERADDKIVRIA